uniref:DUF637 domain-containing protein n=1 Tax=Pseudomonas corrugata TaxID=47879 RepID=UPI000AB902C3
VQQQATTLAAGGDVTVAARNDLLMAASRIKAGNEAYLVAAKQISLLAEQDRDYSLYDMKKKGGWGSLKMRHDEVTQVTHVGSQIQTGGDLTLKSGDDQRYQVAKLQSGKDLTIDSGGAIIFEGVKDLHDETHTKTNNNAFWNSAKGKGNTDETLRQTQMAAAGAITIKAVEGLKIDIKHVDRQTVSQTIDAMVKADPQLAWIKEAEQRGDVDWRQVKEIHESFKYNTSGLGPASQLIIAIALAAVMGPMMASLNTMVQAGAISVATKATVSTIDNRGNLGAVLKDVTSKDSMKGYAVSIATAGVAQGLNYNPSTVGFNTEGLKTVAMKVTADAAIKTAVYGGSFKDNLATSLAGTAASIGGAYGAGKIGDLGLAEGGLEKILLHSALGGLMAEVMGGDFRTGAIAGGANEALIGLLGDTLLPSNLKPGTPEYIQAQENLVALSKIAGVLGAAATNGDLDVAAQVAENGTRYNFLNHRDVLELAEKAKNCELEGTCDALQAEANARDAANRQRLMDCQRLGNCPEIRAEIDAGSKAIDNLVATLPEGKSADILGKFTGIGGGNTRDWTTVGQLHIEQVAHMFVDGDSQWAPSFGQWLDQSGFNPFSINAPGLSATVVPGGIKTSTSVFADNGYFDVLPGNNGSKSPGYTVTRSDNDFSSSIGGNGKPKAYINEDGELVPPNPEGTGSIQTHVRGGGSENSPYISVTDPSAASNPKNYGVHKIEIDVTRLQQDIDSGALPNTKFLSNREIAAEMQSRVDAARERYTNSPSTKNETSLTRAEADLRNITRDGECLIKGCVPAKYIKFID